MIRDLARLIRLRLCLLAAGGVMAGYLLEQGRADGRLCFTALAAFLLAAGCSALNQAQERRRDAAMGRTRNRPLPARRLGLGAALTLALSGLTLALALLWTWAGGEAALLGLAVIGLYNGLYTPLKGRTPFALLLGGVAGALPPVLGWLAAGGALLDFRVLLLALVFYLWQVPHFALLARLHPGDYQAAGLPLAGLAQGQGRGRASLWVWLAGYCAVLTMVPAFSLVGTPLAKFFLLALGLGLGLAGVLAQERERLGLRLVNLSLVMFLACVIADAWWLGA